MITFLLSALTRPPTGDLNIVGAVHYTTIGPSVLIELPPGAASDLLVMIDDAGNPADNSTAPDGWHLVSTQLWPDFGYGTLVAIIEAGSLTGLTLSNSGAERTGVILRLASPSLASIEDYVRSVTTNYTINPNTDYGTEQPFSMPSIAAPSSPQLIISSFSCRAGYTPIAPASMQEVISELGAFFYTTVAAEAQEVGQSWTGKAFTVDATAISYNTRYTTLVIGTS